MTARLLAPPVKRCHMFATTARLGFTVAMVLMLSAARLGAFALLGPYAPWMTPAIGYQYPGDIGGPMNIGEEYRWNVPVVTYAFDQSFVDYFGSNGVAAVEQALQILNDLPPASSMVLTNYPLESDTLNYSAAALNLYDLKSAALSLIVEQLGLAAPSRYVFALPRWDPVFWTFRPIYEYVPDYVMMRNFDPDTLLPTIYLNGAPYTGYVRIWGPMNPDPARVEAVVYPMWPPSYAPAVADWKSTPYSALTPGGVLFGLTYDDAGGLRYLLSTNNINPEMLLPDVHGIGTNAGAYVNLALRPGVEKLTFVRQQYDPLLGQAIPINTNYTDTYITNGIAVHQQVERVIIQPDFLFCTADTGADDFSTPDYVRTGTSNWWNSASVTGSTNAGPGVIRSPVKIVFNKLSPWVATMGPTPPAPYSQGAYWWGSFDASSNAPVIYPVGAGPVAGPVTIRFHLEGTPAGPYPPPGPPIQWLLTNCASATLLTSTNLVNWVACGVVTNQGPLVEWYHVGGASLTEFFRVVGQ